MNQKSLYISLVEIIPIWKIQKTYNKTFDRITDAFIALDTNLYLYE
jgi:hypothetical protein